MEKIVQHEHWHYGNYQKAEQKFRPKLIYEEGTDVLSDGKKGFHLQHAS